MKLRIINETDIASYTSDPKYWDKDPDFVKTIHLLNKAGFKTTSSCMGHAPGTQYKEIDEWMDPYITFVDKSAQKLFAGSGFVTNNPRNSKCCVSFRRGVNWADVLKYIQSRLM
jgi:hypothetical protein